jgi:hypothetical protein
VSRLGFWFVGSGGDDGGTPMSFPALVVGGCAAGGAGHILKIERGQGGGRWWQAADVVGGRKEGRRGWRAEGVPTWPSSSVARGRKARRRSHMIYL